MADITSFLDETEDVDALWTLIEVSSGAIRHAVEHHLAPVSRLFTGVLSHVAISHQRLTKVSAQKSEAKEAASLALNTSIEAASKASAQEESLILRSIQTTLGLSSQPQQETTAIEDPLQGSVQEKKKVAGGRSAMADALRLASASRPSWTSCCSLETIISGKIGGISGTSIPVDPEISNFLHLCVGDPRPTCLSRTHTADLCLLSGGSIDRDAHQSRSGKDVARSADQEQSFGYLGRRVPIDVLL